MTLGPDDLPPPGGQKQKLHCSCTNSTFEAIFDDQQCALVCTRSDCRTIVTTFPLPGVEAITGDRDMLPGQTFTQVPQPPRRADSKALLRGGPLDGKTIPMLPDVTTFMVGSGYDAMATGAAWADSAQEAVVRSAGQVDAYADSGDRTPEGLRIFAYQGG